jgi:hypothetical protein
VPEIPPQAVPALATIRRDDLLLALLYIAGDEPVAVMPSDVLDRLFAAAKESEGEHPDGDTPARGCEAPLAGGTMSARDVGSSDDRMAPEGRTALVEAQRVRAVVHNATDRALSARGHWVPLRVRIGIAETVLASLAVYGYRLVYDEAEGSTLGPVQEALESTETDNRPGTRKVGSPDLCNGPEGRTALRDRYAEALAFESPAWGVHGPPWLLRDTIEKIADAVLSVRDDVLAEALRRAERAEEIVRVVSATTAQWAAMAPADDWGPTPADTVLADAGRIIFALIGPPAALDVPADGEQPPTPATEETDRG